MKIKRIHLLYLFSLVLLHTLVLAQNKKLDSLKALLNNAAHDSIRLRLYLNLCTECIVSDNLKYAEPALKLADKLLPLAQNQIQRKALIQQKIMAYDFISVYYERTEPSGSTNQFKTLEKIQQIREQEKDTVGITNSIISFSEYYFRKGDILKQLQTLQNGLKRWEQANYKLGMAKFIAQIGLLYATQGDTTSAIDYLEKGIELEKSIGDKERISKGYYLTGLLYSTLNYHHKAIYYYSEALNRYTKSSKLLLVPEIYLKLGEAYQSLHQYNKAQEAYNTGYKIAEEIYDPRVKFLITLAKGTADEQMGNYAKAIEQHLMNYETALKLRENFYAVWLASHALSIDHFKAGEYNKAKSYSDKALKIIKDKGAASDILSSLKMAYQIDSATNNHKGAHVNYKEYMKLRDQLNGEEVKKAAIRGQFQFQLENQKQQSKLEQERKDQLNEKENQYKNNIILAVSLGLLLVLLLIGFVYRGLQQNKQINKELVFKNNLIEKQKNLVEEKHKEITDSINYAERIQSSFLASKEELDEQLNDYFVYFKPKDVVSGDFYWCHSFRTKNQNKFYLLAADSTGHGVPGAIMSLLNITSIEKAIEVHSEPAEILNHTRKTIIDRLKKDGSNEGGKDGMDCSLLVFDKTSYELKIAAANNPVWIIRDQNITEIKPDRMPVGKSDKEHIAFVEQSYQLKPGDAVYVLTDGFPDQFGGPSGKKFKSKKLKEELMAMAHLPMAQQKIRLQAAFEKWLGDLEQVDDVLVIGIRV